MRLRDEIPSANPRVEKESFQRLGFSIFWAREKRERGQECKYEEVSLYLAFMYGYLSYINRQMV